MATAKKKVTKKAAPKKTTAKKAPAAKKAKSTEKKAGGGNSAFMKPMTISPALAEVIGATPVPRTEVTKKLWAYIKKNKLQDAAKKTMINADAKLQPIFKKKQVSMFEMTKLVSAHLS
ncbi:MAG: SWIB/MDM2 domain-containing protein [Clostridia bacterium]|nr:SWIB/MDM2 domain-containing protein [Deltaproteobacteria bacterium]